jgi:hypothetical protein
MLQYTNGHRRAISGAGLAQLRRRMSAAERACLAADIVDGRVVLQGLTVKAIAALVGVNVGYVDRALRLTPEQRAEVCRGDRPLVLPRTPAPASHIDWNAINDDDLVEAVRRIGIDRALAAAVEVERGA